MQDTVHVHLALPPRLWELVTTRSVERGHSIKATYIQLLARGLDLPADDVLDLMAQFQGRARRKARQPGALAAPTRTTGQGHDA